MKKLYVCQTVFTLYYVMIKELSCDNEVDIVITDYIPQAGEIYEKLCKDKFFSKVFYFEEKELRKTVIDQNKNNKLRAAIFFFSKENQTRLISRVEDILKLDFAYDEINVFNERIVFSLYLSAKGLKYNIIEDGKNALVLHYNRRRRMLPVASFLEKIGLVWWVPWGMSDKVCSICTNDASGITNRAILRKLIVCNSDGLISSLTAEQKRLIYDFFTEGYQPLKSSSEDVTLVLTEPLWNDSAVSSEAVQLSIYKDIVEQYQDNTVILKPHPRDLVKYDSIASINIMEKNIPIEVVGFREDIHYKNAVTITSTSINGIRNVDNKIMLGREYLERKIREYEG